MFREVTPLSETDCFLVFLREKTEFKFPIHVHTEYELNFIENADGAFRFVGDSIERINDLELTLIAGPDLEHAWTNGECQSKLIKEITIQFHPDLVGEGLLNKNQFKPVREMFEKAECGVTFPYETVLKVKPQLELLAKEPKGAHSVLQLFSILYDLSLSNEIRTLSSKSLRDNNLAHFDSRRIERAFRYMQDNFDQEIRLADVASVVGMSEVTFSRFIKKRAGKNFVDALNEIRLSNTCQMLVDTTRSISEICFACGFNNLSNFNRIFRKKKNCTPKKFRENYWKNRIVF